MNIKSSWSTKDLQSLTDIKNHKFIYDGYEYCWIRKLEDKWERHFILNFTDKKKAFHYLKFNLDNWQKELTYRLKISVRSDGFKQLKRMLHVQEKTINTANSNLPTIEKINHIKLINEGITVNQLSNLLNINKSIIYRHIRTLKQRGTLYSA